MENVYPLILSLQEAVPGNHFLAGVKLCGRVLAVPEEEGEWWFYGVQPGAVAEGGSTPPEAYARLVSSLRNVLLDMGSQADGFEAFKTEVERFVAQVDETESKRWHAAVERFRTGTAVSAPFSELPKKSADGTPFFVTVDRLDPAPSFEGVTQAEACGPSLRVAA